MEVSHPPPAPLCLKSIDMQITISVVTSTMADKIQKAVKGLLWVQYILGTKFFSQKCRLQTNKFMIEKIGENNS